MDNNLLSQAQSQFIYNDFAGCAGTCDQILGQDACNYQALHYKSMSLMKLSTVDNFRMTEAIKAAEVCKNLSMTKTQLSDEILTTFNREMDRIGQELLMKIKASNNRDRNSTCLTWTHNYMKSYETAMAAFPEASPKMKKLVLQMCNKWLSGLTGWAHDAANIHNSRRPYNDSLKRMLSGGAAVDVQVPTGMRQSEFGVAGFVCSFFPFVCFLGVVLSIVGIAVQWKSRRKGLAIAGIVIGIVVSIFTLAIMGAAGY